MRKKRKNAIKINRWKSLYIMCVFYRTWQLVLKRSQPIWNFLQPWCRGRCMCTCAGASTGLSHVQVQYKRLQICHQNIVITFQFIKLRQNLWAKQLQLRESLFLHFSSNFLLSPASPLPSFYPRETVPSLISDKGKKTVSVLIDPLLLP